MSVTGPLKFLENRVFRDYIGGYLLGKFRGKITPDNHYPEEWIGSLTQALRPDGSVLEGEGLSKVLVDGEEYLFKDLLREDPEYFLGEKNFIHPGILIKYLDSAVRLTVQVHPTKEFARKYLNSEFGKTESWIILGTRRIKDEEPYLLLGFKDKVEEKDFIEKRKRWDPEIWKLLNKISVKPGDVFLIKAGVPHAIGPGVFMIEIQEPSDWTIFAENKCGDYLIDENFCNMNLPEDLVLRCFDFSFRENTYFQLKRAPKILACGSDYEILSLIDYSATECFSVKKIILRKGEILLEEDRFFIFIILSGKGELHCGKKFFPYRQADSFFIPAGEKRLRCVSYTHSEFLVCYGLRR